MASTFRERLRWAREVADLSQRELSELAELSAGHVWALETENEKLKRDLPEVETVLALARVLGVSLDWLIAGEGGKPDADAIVRAVKKAQKTKTAQPTGT